MNGIAIIFLVINAIAILRVTRRFAPLPLIVGACYMTLSQAIDIGPLTFNVLRILILAGYARVIIRSERLFGGINKLDKLMLIWSAVIVVSSFFHEVPLSALVLRLGFVYDAIGIYFLLRVFCQDIDELVLILSIIAIVLVPVALEMVHEKITLKNYFAVFGGVPEIPAIRSGKVRAQGPFAHAILAGTVGAACLPLMIGLYNHKRKLAYAGIAACLLMVFSCSSSGPMLSTMAGIGAIILWKYRKRMKLLRWFGILFYIALDLYMNAPAYYLMARIDLAGGSTGWHRARLIQSAFEHINEWWLWGTDYTRHWMPTGVSWSPLHTDITNYYIKMGVIGGFPMMLLFIFILWTAFRTVGSMVENKNLIGQDIKFTVWTLGAALFAIAATSISVNFFDQSFSFVYLVIGIISSVGNTKNDCLVKKCTTKDIDA